MTSCRQPSPHALAFPLSSEPFGPQSSDMLRARSLADAAADAVRPSALRALLLLCGGTQPGDASLLRMSDAEQAVLREALDLLSRTEAARTA